MPRRRTSSRAVGPRRRPRPARRSPARRPRRSTDYRRAARSRRRGRRSPCRPPTTCAVARAVPRARHPRARREADGGRRSPRPTRCSRAAAASGAMLAVGHTERFNPGDCRRRCRCCGTPRFIEVHRLSGFPERSLDIDVIFDVMIHDLDIILAIDRSGGRRRRGRRRAGADVAIDIANARVKFASGCIANITASRISRDKVRKVRCFQPDMYVSVDYGAQELEVWRLRRGAGERPAIEGGPVAGRRRTSRCGASWRISSRPSATGRRAARDRRMTAARALALATRVAEADRRRDQAIRHVYRHQRVHRRARAPQGARAHRRAGQSRISRSRP